MRSAALAGLAALGACSGGGGGGGINPPPAPVPTPTPTPVPTPAPSPTPTPGASYDTAEYRATVGAVSMNALIAYDRGDTGSGIRVGIIDSGIDLQSEEFGDCSGGIGTASCRITSASIDAAGNGSIDDVGGHGTAVAFTLAGRRNGAGTHGVAFDAQLIVARADSVGSCSGTPGSNGESPCRFDDVAIAAGLDAARTGGARVVNISLGGSAPEPVLLRAIDRATAAGIVLVISAGNDGPDALNPDEFTSAANNAAIARGLIIIAGSVGANDVISSFSNRAGTSAGAYLAAVGEDVRAPDQTGVPFLWSGTSFSAPQIAGAVALLAQAFPNMSGAQIVQLLFATARDVGPAGVDAVYGHGVLDLTRAFEPVGTMSLAGSGGVASQQVNASLSAPMGDARQGALGAVVLDSFDRAFAMDLARTINRQGFARRLPDLMASRDRSFSVGMHDMQVAVSLVPGRDSVRIERLGITGEDAGIARMLAATVSGRLGSKAQFAIGASESGNALTARLAGRDDPAFLVARDPATNSGFDVDVGGSVAVRQALGSWGLTVASEFGDVLTRRDTEFEGLRWRPERFGYGRTTLALDRRFGGLRAGLSLTRLAEDDTVLGARFSGALGAARADSLFVDLGLRADLGGGWNLGGSMRQGWTDAQLRAGVRGSGLIRTNAFSGDIGKTGLLLRGDTLGFRVAQPLRVASGGIDIALPQGWDYYTESVDSWAVSHINLAPQGREIDYELRYRWPLAGGDISSNLFLRSQPGNFAALPPDKGGAIRFTWGF
ncbi:S8 family peptidase [Sphingomonas sp. dw_22]|uniref:S8 family peptidase n=1 Tax=Sphingomonas sp. dw_22 TaxID=2721175 RepID=UPI0023DEB8DF|nr:S8 family peptidase [Sphingomonas sp. dw_22]